MVVVVQSKTENTKERVNKDLKKYIEERIYFRGTLKTRKHTALTT